MWKALLLIVLGSAPVPAQVAPFAAQDTPAAQPFAGFGMREIDKLPKSTYAEPLWGESWSYWTSRTVQDRPALWVHPKPSFRVGPEGLERLCVVEACAPGTYRQTALIFHTALGWAWDQPVDWLAHKPQYRAVWLPVLQGQVRAVLVAGGKPVASAEYATDLDPPAGLFDLSVPDEPAHVDHGFALLPASQVLAHPGQFLSVRFACATQDSIAHAGAELTDGSQAVACLALNPEGNRRVASGRLTTAGLATGAYGLALTARLADGRSVAEHRVVRVVQPARELGFAVRSADLTYAAPVYVSRTETRPWQDLWRGSPLRDLVVSFSGTAMRMVFWRGANYVPCWAANSSWLSYEWLEAEPDLNGAVDCVEPIMDKECRFSRVRVVSASPARIVVHWRYGLTDFVQKVINDEWADEFYTLYPDATGTRKLVGWYKSGWHENQEFLLLNRPGNAPHQSVEPQALTLLTTDGRSQRPVWPRPYFEVGDWPHLICKVNLPGRDAPFMVVDRPGSQIKVWSEPYVDKPGLFNTYLHWPVSRGIRTTWLDNHRDFARPTHSNLANVVTTEAVREADRHIWYWLIGVTRSERALRETAAAWLEPAPVQVTGGRFDSYDRSQRAYLVDADPGCTQLSVTFRPAGAAVVNPAVVIRNAGPWLTASQCPAAAEIRLGRENGNTDLVLWLRGRFTTDTTLTVN